MGFRTRFIGFAACVALGAPALPASLATVTGDPAQGAVWDLSPLFRDAAAWEKERLAVETAVPGLSQLKGTFGSSATALRTGLERISAVRQRLERLSEYADLNADVDASNDANQARTQQMSTLQSRFDEATSFVKPEILVLGRERIETFAKTDPALSTFRRPIELILRQGPHTLDPEAEALVAATGPLRRQPAAIHDTFLYGEFPWPSLEIDGKMTLLAPEAYSTAQSNANREIRRQAYDSVSQSLSRFEGTAGAIAFGHLAGMAFEAKARHYPGSLALAVSDDAMPETAFQIMVTEADKAQSALLRYLKIRQKLLGLPEMHVYDLYVPPTTDPRRYSLDEAETLILKALAPLGDEYVRTLQKGFQGHRMHAVAQPGKAPGALTEWQAYGVPPYVMLTFDGSFDSVSTVAHEWGHAINGQLMQAAQPYENTEIASIFLIDTPSLTNEMLLSDHMIANAKSRQDQILALDQAIELLRSSYFGVFVDVDFEMKAHEIVDRGDVVTGQTLNQIYCGLYKRFHGIDAGVTTFDASACSRWVNRPAIYDNFYFYKYLTAVSAAAYFVDGIESNDAVTRQRYLELLKAGGSEDPYVLLKRAGFDAASPAAYQPIIRRLERLVGRLEAIVAVPGDAPPHPNP
jgi:oligoendopeptidase F